MCKHLFEVPFAERMADHWTAEMKRVKRYRDDNKEKQKHLLSVKNVMKTDKATKTDDGTEAKESAGEEDESTVKRTRRVVRSMQRPEQT